MLENFLKSQVPAMLTAERYDSEDGYKCEHHAMNAY